tara:strand:+ start:20920 stop:21891 length:972 start_codon:yes stop_codon:yes gene_type:complete
MNQELDIIIRKIIRQKFFVLFFSFIGTLISLVYLLFFYQPDFTSTSKIYLSDKQSNQISLGGLSQLGFQVPFSGGSATSQMSVIGEIVESYLFLEDLLGKEINISSSETSLLYDWMNIGSDADNTEYKNIVNSSLELRKMITVVENYQSSIIKIEVTANNNYVAQSVNKILIESVNSLLIKKNSEKASNKLLFIDERIVEAENDLKISENRLKDFRYRNTKVSSSPDLQMQLENLLRDVNFKTNILSTLFQQREVAKIQKNEKTESFNILSDPNFPVYPSSPRRLYQLIVYIAFSIALPILFIISKIFYTNLLNASRKYYNKI